jgi:hypothetical protein
LGRPWTSRRASGSGRSASPLTGNRCRSLPKHSINVLSDVIMLYKPGASGRSLGAIDTFGPAELDALLASAAEEFGQMMEEANV